MSNTVRMYAGENDFGAKPDEVIQAIIPIWPAAPHGFYKIDADGIVYQAGHERLIAEAKAEREWQR